MQVLCCNGVKVCAYVVCSIPIHGGRSMIRSRRKKKPAEQTLRLHVFVIASAIWESLLCVYVHCTYIWNVLSLRKYEKTHVSVCSVLLAKLSFITKSNFQETRNLLSDVQITGGFTRVIRICCAFLSRICKTYTVGLDFRYITLNIVL